MSKAVSNGNHTRRVVRLSVESQQQLQELSDSYDESISALLKRAVSSYYKRVKKREAEIQQQPTRAHQ